MLLTTKVKVKWVANKTRKHYEKKGYMFTCYGDEFEIPVEDLLKSSNVIVMVECDYCKNIVPKEYGSFRKSRDDSPVKKDVCTNCHPLKTKEGNMQLHGVEHYTQKKEEAEKIGNRKRLNFEYIKEEFNKRNLILLSKTYKNSTQILEYTCKKHPEKGVMKGSWSNIKNQIGCGPCGYEEGGRKQIKEYKEIKEMFNSKNFIILTPEHEYVNTKTDVEYYCESHPEDILTNTPDAVRYVQGCMKCSRERNSGENHHKWKGGITELSDYLRPKINKWREDSMNFWNCKCVITGESADVIHHLHSFRFLIKITLERLKLDIRPFISNYNEKEKRLLVEMINEVHVEYGYGVALTRSMHLKFHNEYGTENNTPEQFEEFKQKMKFKS